MSSVLVDLYKLKNRHSGLGEFSHQFHEHLIQAHPHDLDFTFLHPRKMELETAHGHRYRPVSLQKRYVPRFNPSFRLWHSLQQFPSHRPNRKTPWLLTIHDLNFLTEKNTRKAARYLQRLQKHVNQADHISTISHYTAGQIKEHLQLRGKEPVVIHNGVYLQEYPDAPLPSYLGNAPFFFSIGIFSEKKNFKALLPLMNHFPDHKLVLAGNNGTAYGREVRETIGRLGLNKQVLLPGQISNEEKYTLYKNARALLFPTTAEGFGLPVIEAMMAGTPVFLSRYASLPEIGGDQAFYWDSFDPELMAETLERGLASFEEDRQAASRALQEYTRQFSWENCIHAYLQLYRSILS
ncbi:MAG TPA: glycosyl transferase family 1 [Cryomorphaceae bacterium]|nr:glycosyl transferase family 1 [Cryomorphaceae bacterium]